MNDVTPIDETPQARELWRHRTEHGRTAMRQILSNPKQALLVCDFDGTLAAIVEDPTTSRMQEESAAALARLGGEVAGIAIVTGRDVETVIDLGDLRNRQCLAALVVMGQYGDETWNAETDELVIPPAPLQVRRAKGDIEDLLRREADNGRDVEGVVIEDKGRAIGVHTRRAADPQGAIGWLGEALERIANRHDLTLEPGRNVIELRSSRTSKGDAVNNLLDSYAPSVAVMIGDDLGDVPAFEAMVAARKRGVTTACVVSGSDEESSVEDHADIWCDGPDGVAVWLTALADGITSAG